MGTLIGWTVTEGFEYQITNSECVSIKPLPGPDGVTSEVKATFANGAVLRMTLSSNAEQPFTFESSAGPFRM